MSLIKVAAAVLNQTPLDWDENKANILCAIDNARAEQVSILCLPELCISGYGCEDAFFSDGLCQTSLEVLLDILPATKDLIVAVGLPLRLDQMLYNTACLLVDGRIAGFTAKQHLAGTGVYYEPRWFNAWPKGVCKQYLLREHSYPIGDVYYRCGIESTSSIKIGFEICEDAWVASRPGAGLAHQGVDLILNPSASHFSFGKHQTRKEIVTSGSKDFGVAYIYTNLLGNDAGRIIFDGGSLIASNGKLLAQGPRLSFSDYVLTCANINFSEISANKALQVHNAPQNQQAASHGVDVPFAFAEVANKEIKSQRSSWEDSSKLKEEEFCRAITLGLFDYMRKSHSKGFVVSLSGGADSSACACLVFLMARLAIEELGIKGFLKKLNYYQELKNLTNISSLMKELLTCVYQSSKYSSQTTLNAAKNVASAINANFLTLDIEQTVSNYLAMVEKALLTSITWAKHDKPLQNIQARSRGPGAWLIANLKNALLLATSNRSEAAVGYATMDGDTCGGLSPISGIDKAFLLQWLKWLETSGPSGVHAISALSAVNSQIPTAELRPAEMAQTDESDLMPYPVLEQIEDLAIGQKMTPLASYRTLAEDNPTVSSENLITWVERFYTLWSQNQWKRERFAPGFHVDDKNLDPKTWCRFPILSGGFKRELRELRAEVSRESIISPNKGKN